MRTLAPTTPEAVRDAVAQANADHFAWQVRGGGTRRAMLADATAVLDLRSLQGITDYQPAELVLTLRAGTPVAEVEARLAANRQVLAFDPPRLAARLGQQTAQTTIGGVIGAGWAGPRRLSVGSARDHLLGFEAVSGRGECFRAGGKVIKNVTGYDLPKLMAGSWGSLAVLTELSLRVVPQPEFETTLCVRRADVAEALADLRSALATSLEVGCAAHLPDGCSVLRLEGFRRSVEERLQGLRRRFQDRGELQVLEPDESRDLWRRVRDLDGFAPEAQTLWCVSLPSTAAAAFVQGFADRGAQALIDWGGARVWLALPGDDDVHDAAQRAGGHAWLVQAPEVLRARLGTAPRLPAPLAALNQRVKQAFDPNAVLGPGPLAAPR